MVDLEEFVRGDDLVDSRLTRISSRERIIGARGANPPYAWSFSALFVEEPVRPLGWLATPQIVADHGRGEAMTFRRPVGIKSG